MELLWLDMTSTGGFPDGVSNFFTFSMSIGTPPDSGSDVSFNNPLVFAQLRVLAVGLPQTLWLQPGRFDFQSNDGYGYLLASDAFNVNVSATLIQANQTYDWKLFYRFVDIPLTEFIGIVQSTQQI